MLTHYRAAVHEVAVRVSLAVMERDALDVLLELLESLGDAAAAVAGAELWKVLPPRQPVGKVLGVHCLRFCDECNAQHNCDKEREGEQRHNWDKGKIHPREQTTGVFEDDKMGFMMWHEKFVNAMSPTVNGSRDFFELMLKSANSDKPDVMEDDLNDLGIGAKFS